MSLVHLSLKGVSKITNDSDAGLIELVTDDGLTQLSIVCDGAMITQFAFRLAKFPLRRKLLPEVLWMAFGEGWKMSLNVLFSDFIDGEFIVYLKNEQTRQSWPVRASDAVLFSVIAHVPIFAELSLVEDYGAPVDNSGKGVTMPLKLLPTEMLRQALQKAIDKEDYEQASQLNDELKKREARKFSNRDFS